MKIAIGSGKGGTGKTFVSTNLFWVASRQGFDCVLADCDAEEPNAAEFISGEEKRVEGVYRQVPVIDPEKCTFCGRCHDYCSYNAIFYLPERRRIQVFADLCHDCGACSYACREGAITENPKLLGWVREMVTETGRPLIEGRAEVGVYSPYDREIARAYAEGEVISAVDDRYREVFSRLLAGIVQRKEMGSRSSARAARPK